jgi:hypothetical protein
MESPSVTCEGSERLFSLTLDAPATSDVSWILEDVAKARTRMVSPVYQDTVADASPHHHEYCLTIDGCYKFVLKDASGSGVSFVATFDGEVIAEGDGSTSFSVNGGDFGSTCRLARYGRESGNLGRAGTGKANGIMFDVQPKQDSDVMFFRLPALRLEGGAHSVKIHQEW